MNRVVSKYKLLRHYTWGTACEGWNFVDKVKLRVKLERMPPGTREAMHYHQCAQQFFFILNGTATFEIKNKIIRVKAIEGIGSNPGKRHHV